MTAVDEGAESPEKVRKGVTSGQVLVRWVTTTDHKVIAHMYLITAFGFFLLAGVLAMVMRAELARPGQGHASRQTR